MLLRTFGIGSLRLNTQGACALGLWALGLWALGLWALTANATAQTIEVGSQPVHEFRQKPLNSMGIETLADLRGKPVLIEYWGTT